MSALTLERLRNVLHYNPETGVWTWLQMLAYRAKVGTRAGSIGDTGYRVIGIDGENYKSSRLAFFYMTGTWPREIMDHVNLDKLDDSWLNLREATATQNNGNWKILSTNKSGYKGVSWSKNNQKWVAYIQINRKNRNLGYFENKEDAAAAYACAARQTFGEFARTT